MTPGPLLEAVALHRSYGATRALDGVEFALERGETLTVFGPNGAGKTSLLRVLAGSLEPSSGEVRIDGVARATRDPRARGRIGVLSHQSFLYGHLTAAENLSLYGRLYGLRDLAERVPERLERVGLGQVGERRVSDMSRGMIQRVALARTLLHDPDIVLLDEPYTGLDAHAAAELRERLRGLRDGRRTIVMVTHNLGQGIELADRVAIQVSGKLRYLGDDFPRGVEEFDRFYRRTVESPT